MSKIDLQKLVLMAALGAMALGGITLNMLEDYERGY